MSYHAIIFIVVLIIILIALAITGTIAISKNIDKEIEEIYKKWEENK